MYSYIDPISRLRKTLLEYFLKRYVNAVVAVSMDTKLKDIILIKFNNELLSNIAVKTLLQKALKNRSLHV